jgi:hypothetical protein
VANIHPPIQLLKGAYIEKLDARVIPSNGDEVDAATLQ